MYRLPQEIEVWYVIPAIRRELARFLTKEHGLSYEKTARILGITKAAIAQYHKNKRASKIKLDPRVVKEIEKSSKIVIKDKERTVKEMMRILAFMRTKKISFEICEDGFQDGSSCREVKIAYENYWDC